MTTRERTIQLPEPLGPDGDGQLWLDDPDIRVDLTGGRSLEYPPTIYWMGKEISAAAARSTGLALLAAAELITEAEAGA